MKPEGIAVGDRATAALGLASTLLRDFRRTMSSTVLWIYILSCKAYPGLQSHRRKYVFLQESITM